MIDGEDSQSWQYVAVFLLIMADAVIPILPSESTLNTASTLAAAGEFELELVDIGGDPELERRVVSLPEDADPARVEASYRDGLLRISVAKRESSLPRRIEVN